MSRRTQKPPTGNKLSNNQPSGFPPALAPPMQRASSVNGTENILLNEELSLKNQTKSDNIPAFIANQSTATTYNAPEEPLRNAD